MLRTLVSICLTLVAASATHATQTELRTIAARVAFDALRRAVLPAFPHTAEAAAPGTVTVEVIIGSTGTVVTASATTGPDAFRAAAEAAAAAWAFRPLILNGEAIEARVQLVFRFTKDQRVMTDAAGGVLSGPPGAVAEFDAGRMTSAAEGVTLDPKAKRVASTVEFYEREARLKRGVTGRVKPIHPPSARGVRGLVVVTVLVRPDGTVKEAQIVSGPSELHEAALEAARQWRFERNDEKDARRGVAFGTTIAFNFE